jgi:hypothetical protein
MTAVYLGFGIFLANSQYKFRQYSDYRGSGWGAQTVGYLNQLSLCYALAIFTELQTRDPREASKHLCSSARGYYQGAIRDLRKRWSLRIEQLRWVSGDDR